MTGRTPRDGTPRQRLTPEEMRANARRDLEAKELAQVKQSADGQAVTLADVRAAARKKREEAKAKAQLEGRGGRERRMSTESMDSQMSFRSMTSSLSSVNSLPDRWEALPLTEGEAVTVMVATGPLTLREEADLESPMCRRNVLRPGSTVCVLEELELSCGTQRAKVVRQGRHEAAGWVSKVTKDGTPGLVGRAEAFKERLAKAAATSDDAKMAEEERRKNAIQRKLKESEEVMKLRWKYAASNTQGHSSDASDGRTPPKRPMPSAPYPVSEEMWNSEDDAHDVSDTPPKVRRETSSRDVVDGRTPPKVRRESKEDLPVLAAVALEEKSEAPPKARKPQRSVRILPAAMNA